MLLCSRKRLKILDVNCLPLSRITFFGLPLITIHSSNTSKTSIVLFLSHHLLATFLEQSSKQFRMLSPCFFNVLYMVLVLSDNPIIRLSLNFILLHPNRLVSRRSIIVSSTSGSTFLYLIL